MNKERMLVSIFILSVLAIACKNTKQKETSNNHQEATGTNIDRNLLGVNFSRSINGADSLVKADDQKITMSVAGEKDYFSDPDGKLSNKTSPILLSKIDNTKPFTISAKITPNFFNAGMYNAGVLFLYLNDDFWQKFCFEQSEGGEHRIVTVRNINTSDDNNHDVVSQPFVYMKISSDTKTIANYYSLDNKTWKMVRLYKNDYPNEFYAGISTQCPIAKEGTTAIFEELIIKQESVKDFRLGN